MKPLRDSPASTVSKAVDRTIMVREIDGELVALDTRANLVHQLNATASLIWRLAADGCDVDEIAAAVTSEYDIDLTDAYRDVCETLARLQALKLLART